MELKNGRINPLEANFAHGNSQKKVAVVIFDEKFRIDYITRQNGKSWIFCKIFPGKNGFWTNIFVHFPNPNHFLCFDKYMILRTYANII
jgi:hypothetical protein